MNKQLFLLLITAFLGFVRCVPPNEDKLTEVHVDFTNPAQQDLYDLQDRGMTDSLYPYFRHKDPTYRYLAVLAFASIRDTLAVDTLAKMLTDPIDQVSIAAAYALGQIGSAKAEEFLIEAFDSYDTVGVSRFFNAAILEAIGKCATPARLSALATISTYRVTDSTLLEGQAWGIYRYALRDIVSEEGTSKMLEFATNTRYPAEVRLIGANYLTRAKGIDLEKKDSLIAPALPREDDARVRMALAIALGKTKSERAANALLYQYNIEQDYRVRTNILRALGNFDYELVKPVALRALNDPFVAVAVTAGEYFVEHGTSEDASTYWQMAKEPGRPWEVQMALYAAASKHLPYFFEESRKYLNWELKRRFENSPNPYEKAAAIKAIAQNGWNYKYIRDAAYPSDIIPVRTASVEALAGIARMPNFNQFFVGSARVKKDLSDYFRDAIENGDVGMMAVAAEVLRDPKLGFKSTFDSLAILENALKKLRIPQEIETYNEVKKTLDYFKGEEPGPAAKPRYNHKIDWKVITALKPEPKVLIKTAKGNITLLLMPELAPGTVANILALIRDKFYDGKNFHRVVPNFVAQGGCTRGDGFGSLNYTIRSELPYLHYDEEGYVGMASAGPHTECTQFFINFSPAPHLDGNFTIFAKVVDGMDVVHKLEIGDVMEEVTFVQQ
ncbi:MAG: peptidylprolyl isomerase [Saprospiraceae bacterium]